MSKNLRKVQDMLDGNYKNKIQVGYSKTDEVRKVGDKWTDSDGVEWEQKEGYRSKVSRISVGMFPHQCKDCKTNCDTNKLDKAISTVRSGGDIKKLNTLKLQLDKLNAIGGVDSIVPSEGIVFKYKGKTYKFTGAFAPINQITGLISF